MAELSKIIASHAGPRVGASEVAVLAGISTWNTPLGLYLNKVAAMEYTGPREPRMDDQYQEWGHRLEVPVLRAYAERQGRLVLAQDGSGEPCLLRPEGRPLFSSEPAFKRLVGEEACALILETCQHPEHPYLICHPDGIDLGPSGEATRPRATVQAKTASSWMRGHWTHDEYRTEATPPAYVLQVQAEMLVLTGMMGAVVPGHLLGLLGGNDLRHHAIRPDPEMWEMIIALAAEFARRVSERDPPDPTPDERGRKDLQRLYPGDAGGREIIVTARDPRWRDAQMLGEVRRLREEAEQAEAALALQVQRSMGNATALRGPGVNITWSARTGRRSTQWEAVAQALRARVSEREWEAALTANTRVTPGGRTFRPRIEPLGDEDHE